MHLYLDASALMKLVVTERFSAELGALVTGRSVISAELAVTEVMRATNRLIAATPGSADLLSSRLRSVLERVTFLGVDRDIFELAGRLDDLHLGTLDAIHVAGAVAVGDDVEVFVTYDRQQARAARLAGFEVLAPGVG